MDLPPITTRAVLIGLAILAVGWLIGRVLARATRWVLVRRGRSASAGQVFGGLVGAGLTVVALAAAVTVVFPSVRPVDVFGGIGVVSIAAGIAFQTVLGNMFAGMIILARDRFRVGDQISVGDHAGTVVEMGLSSTALRTFDGRLVLLPNQTLHSEAVMVQTGFSAVRSTVRVDVEAANDLARTREIAVGAMAALPQVLQDPPPQALLTEVGVTTVGMDLRFWSGARQMETKEAIDAVIAAVLTAFEREGVATGDDVRVVDAGPRLRQELADLREVASSFTTPTPPSDGRARSGADQPQERTDHRQIRR
ncbi:mechanosensitive ion channel [Brachybacterium sp. EF45031]|uniref:mechanosensitive ion channel family protein n=1 Tax=Brachybacterium sillae TaxID=2810536 RepID=UPI00217E427A|nr:mechanosensitive ion channel family protein [Brachybacterium sillae]MCS6712000.1 mechanosensitive ion channel [Brachybacterium sillae]